MRAVSTVFFDDHTVLSVYGFYDGYWMATAINRVDGWHCGVLAYEADDKHAAVIAAMERLRAYMRHARAERIPLRALFEREGLTKHYAQHVRDDVCAGVTVGIYRGEDGFVYADIPAQPHSIYRISGTVAEAIERIDAMIRAGAYPAELAVPRESVVLHRPRAFA